jgi:hypothetical protein
MQPNNALEKECPMNQQEQERFDRLYQKPSVRQQAPWTGVVSSRP